MVYPLPTQDDFMKMTSDERIFLVSSSCNDDVYAHAYQNLNTENWKTFKGGHEIPVSLVIDIINSI